MHNAPDNFTTLRVPSMHGQALGISFLQGLLVYPRAKILLNLILDFGPCLRFMAQNVPKKAQKLKIELLRLFFSWGSHFFSIYSPS